MQASTLSIMIRNVLYAFPFKLIKLKARHFYRNPVCLQAQFNQQGSDRV